MTVKKKKILIADDDPDDQEMLVEAMAQLDHSLHIDLVDNGNEVLTYLAERPNDDFPELIVLDYKMPILNAAEVLERLTKQQRYAPIAKIVWSTSRQETDMTRCMNAGAKKFFIKPSNISDLRLIAREMLDQARE